MKRKGILSVQLILATLLYLLPTPSISRGVKRVSITLYSSQNSFKIGKIKMFGWNHETRFLVRLKCVKPGMTYLLKLAGGTCAKPAASATLLARVVSNKRGKGAIKGKILFREREDVALNSITDGQHCFWLDAEDDHYCEDIPAADLL